MDWFASHAKITQLENKVHQATAVMDKDTSKLLNYRPLMNSPNTKSMELFSSQQIWVIGKWHQRFHKEPYQHY
jgi:hypothetical protein